jgi:hypothetical protein
VSRALKSLAIFFAFVAIYTLSRHVIGSSTTSTTTTTASVTSTTLAGTACKATDFSGVYNEGEGAAGTIYASVTLTKSSVGSCALKGWPLLTLQDKLGALLTSSTVDVPSSGNGFQFLTARANDPPATVTLSQNGTAEFSLAYSDVQTGTTACPAAVTLSVQFVVKGGSIDVTPTYPVAPCNNGQLVVSPFY